MFHSPFRRPLRALPWLAGASLAVLAGCHDGKSSSSGGGGGNPTLGAPAISGLAVESGVDFAIVRWTTDVPTLGCVEYGLTTVYGEDVRGAGLTTSHELLLSSLAQDTEYHYRVAAEDSSGRSSVSDDGTFRTLIAGAFLSDDFSRANLFPSPWSWNDPQNQAFLRMVGAGTPVARVELTATEDFDYSVAGSNGAVRLTQPMSDEDFVAETKVLSAVQTPDGESGLFFEQDVDNYARFGFVFDGTDVLLRAAHIAGGALASQDDVTAIFGAYDGSGRLFLRVTRVGDQWTADYSLDGDVFMGGATVNAPLAPAACGPYAANGPGSTADHVAAFDYVFDASRPIENEDGVVRNDDEAPFVYRTKGQAMSDAAIRVRWWSDEPSGGQLDYGLDNAYGLGSTQAQGQAWFQEQWITELDPETPYYVRLLSRDDLGNEVLGGEFLLKTSPAFGGAPIVDVWYGQSSGQGPLRQRFGDPGDAQRQVNILGRVIDADEARLVLSDTLHYSLNGGPERQVVMGDNPAISVAPWRLSAEGDFNIELDISDLTQVAATGGIHENTLELIARDDDGHITVQNVILEYAAGGDWASTTTIDWADVNGVHGGDLLRVAQPVDGYWLVQSDASLGTVLRTDPNALGYDRLVAIGEAAGLAGWSDYVATVPFRVNSLEQSFTPGTGGQAFGAILRWGGHNAGGQFAAPNHNIYPLGGAWIYRWIASSGNERWELWVTENQDTVPFAGDPLVLGQDYTLKARCAGQSGGGTEYSLKVWPAGQTEPVGWQFQHTTSPGDPATGSLALFAHHADVAFGSISVTEL